MTTHFTDNRGSMTDGIHAESNGIGNEHSSTPVDDSQRNPAAVAVSPFSLADSAEFLTAGPIVDAIRKLSRAYEYSVDCDRSRWDFAVEISDLDALGVSHDELRWMIGKGLVEHAQETGSGNGIGRSFDSPGGFTFSGRSCFVATNTGLHLADELTLDTPDEMPAATVRSSRNGAPTGKPHWDDQRHELRVGDVVVKLFKWRAANQEAILSAFQEDGWPARIDDPLPPLPETDPKRRLSDTIKCLNRKQQNSLLRFSGDGTGEGVLWDLVDIGESPDGRSISNER